MTFLPLCDQYGSYEAALEALEVVARGWRAVVSGLPGRVSGLDGGVSAGPARGMRSRTWRRSHTYSSIRDAHRAAARGRSSLPPVFRLFGSRPIHDPDWEPYRHVVELRLAASELNELNRLCLEHGVSRALLLRRAIEYGLPPAVDSLDLARLAGMALCPGRRIRTLLTTGYGPRTFQPITAVFGCGTSGPTSAPDVALFSGTG